MSLEGLAAIAALLASVPLSMVLINLWAYRAPRPAPPGARLPAVSVLIPARNEAASIRAAVDAARAEHEVEIEVVVMDDQSDDATAAIVREIAATDPRVRLLAAPALPAGWCGKQHACFELARAARHPVLLFVDADVRLAPGGIRAMLGALERGGAELISGVPRQITGSFAEKLVVPLIHFVLLGFLPIPAMRLSRRPSWAAGCGQLFMARRDGYFRAGGHAAIRDSRHDGILLPRAFRRAGLRTDLFDASGVAVCRMYRGARELWQGFAKNATEGMAAPAAIVPWTVLLVGGQTLPPLLLVAGQAAGASSAALAWAAAGAAMGLGARLVLAARFRQSLAGALAHPLGVLIVVAIQWYALGQKLAGRGYTWKGRAPVASR